MTGQFRPGERLDPPALAEELLASTTPVREALNQLLGEGLLETRLGVGFSIPLIDEPALKDLYAWSDQILNLAVRSWPEDRKAFEPLVNRPSDAKTADYAAALFYAISQCSINREHQTAVARSNARLHAIRVAEEKCLTDIEGELAVIESHFQRNDKADLKRSLGKYYRRRERRAADMIRETFRHS